MLFTKTSKLLASNQYAEARLGRSSNRQLFISARGKKYVSLFRIEIGAFARLFQILLYQLTIVLKVTEEKNGHVNEMSASEVQAN